MKSKFLLFTAVFGSSCSAQPSKVRRRAQYYGGDPHPTPSPTTMWTTTEKPSWSPSWSPTFSPSGRPSWSPTVEPSWSPSQSLDLRDSDSSEPASPNETSAQDTSTSSPTTSPTVVKDNELNAASGGDGGASRNDDKRNKVDIDLVFLIIAIVLAIGTVGSVVAGVYEKCASANGGHLKEPTAGQLPGVAQATAPIEDEFSMNMGAPKPMPAPVSGPFFSSESDDYSIPAHSLGEPEWNSRSIPAPPPDASPGMSQVGRRRARGRQYGQDEFSV